jgi:hypothetical protein
MGMTGYENSTAPVIQNFVLSKQARRTGMASPLGEMFDHGARFQRVSI